MTPFQFSILLHYLTSTEDHEAVIANVPAWTEARAYFIKNNLLETAVGEGYCTYALTMRGKFYVRTAIELPLPVNTWKIPVTNEKFIVE
jgi:hypothetical protein